MQEKSSLSPHVKGDFDASLALARSLCGYVIPRLKVILATLTLGHTHRYYPRLHETFSATMYPEDGLVYVGRGYPLSSEDEVREIVVNCNGARSAELMQPALEQWQAIVDGKEPAKLLPIVDEKTFDRYLRKNKMPDIEAEVRRWFRPRLEEESTEPGDSSSASSLEGKLTDPPGALTVYSSLIDDLKVIVLYLAYRIGKTYWDTLRRLVITLDWRYLARIIATPHVVVGDEQIHAAAMTLHTVLKGSARMEVLDVLTVQACVGHRALANEYAYITGKSFRTTPSDRIQDVLLKHEDESGTGLSAICLSGGGIRSASFCLGALQVLATYRLFGKFHFISTVSGGGYIGTALMRWMTAKGDDNMSPQDALQFAERELQRLRSADYVQHRMAGLNFDEEGPLTWLRMNSNYLARQLSLFSADAWTIVATYLRNLLIVWMIFWPWFMVFLLIPWFAVWLGHATRQPTFWIPTTVGLVGSVIGVFGASYFYQGNLPGQPEHRFANCVALPRGGDARAAFGALLLVVACFCLSYAMWSAVDYKEDLDAFRDGWRFFWYVWIAIAVTQFVLACLNVTDLRSLWVMMLSAFLAGGVQITLLLCILLGLSKLHGPALFPSHLLSTVRALVTSTLMLVALLIGEGVKAAVRSYTEGPERREHQGRAHAFVFMLLTAWVVSAVLVIGVPTLLSYYGGSAQGVAAAGSVFSLAVSTYLGYRKSSPGKPGAQAPMSFTLLGSIGMVLLAVLISIGAWKTLEHAAIIGNWNPPSRYECMDTKGAPCTAQSAFHLPVDDRVCKVPSAQCVDRSFSDYANALIGKFDPESLLHCLAWMLLSGVIFFLLGFIIRMNEFSLHGFYRDRLIRTFYGGFRSVNRPRRPALFTGFDRDDDVKLGEVAPLYDRRLSKFDGHGKPNKPPFLVINAALNLVRGDALAWQERKADSFTFTAIQAGNYRLGYRPVTRFAGNVKLGTAMAISGAAFNPNMGYNSSTPMAFLMSVFNVRLGWWLGNPKFQRWMSRDPSSSSWRLLQEAAGQTADTGDWVHLSDGGHFDNLGLWEMVHRRCRRILVIDASQDSRFAMEDLYCAIRKIRIDMGIEISAESGPVLLFPRSARASGLYHARFIIRYRNANDNAQCDALNGVLLYLKPCFYGNEPPDIHEYAHKHLEFPHETTADQFFSESQFESYRKLGEWEMLQMLKDVLKARRVRDIPADVPMDTRQPTVTDGTEQRGLFSGPEIRPT